VKQLTKERERLGWSKSELARRTGLHPSQVGLIEAGRFLPYPRQLAKIAAALGWPEDEAERLLEEVKA